MKIKQKIAPPQHCNAREWSWGTRIRSWDNGVQKIKLSEHMFRSRKNWYRWEHIPKKQLSLTLGISYQLSKNIRHMNMHARNHNFDLWCEVEIRSHA